MVSSDQPIDVPSRDAAAQDADPDARAGGPVDQRMAWGLAGGLLALLALSYGNSIWNIIDTWSSGEYQHAWIIPIFAAVILYMRRQPFEAPSTRERWIGVGILSAALVVRVLAAQRVLFTVDNLTLIPSLLGIFIFVGGFKCLRWAASPVLFLIFMLPLPGFVLDNVHKPLQTVATKSSVYTLQTMGIDAYRVGNTIQLEGHPLNVAEQCSGLRMLSVFMALSVALAMLMDDRPMWERVALFVSSVPIALLVNSIRITLTGVFYNFNFKTELVNHVAHDMAGLVMMPMAFGFLWLVYKILAHLVVEEQSADTWTLSTSR